MVRLAGVGQRPVGLRPALQASKLSMRRIMGRQEFSFSTDSKIQTHNFFRHNDGSASHRIRL